MLLRVNAKRKMRVCSGRDRDAEICRRPDMPNGDGDIGPPLLNMGKE